MKIFAYVRVSGKSQIEGDGFDRQEEAIKAFCAANVLTIRGTWREGGVSGTTEGLDRPAFSEMIEYAEDRKGGEEAISAIVVERMDRLARDLMVSEVLLKECRTRELKVFAADQGALIDMASDGDDPTRKLIRQIMGALAEWEKSALVKKLKAARERTGHFGGPVRLGKKPGEEGLIKYMQEKRAEGFSYRRIADSLNDLQVFRRKGTPWEKRTIQRVLTRLNATAIHTA